jgi:enterochelin esterase-like enzyme
MAVRRTALGLVIAAWLAGGLVGSYVYVNRYMTYRGFPVPSTPAGVATGTVELVRYHSRVVSHGARYVVYLPPHSARQAARGRRFPVLYLLHGFPGIDTVFTDVGRVHVVANVLLHRHRIRPMILVMPAGLQGILHGDTEWADTGAGRWESFILDVVHDVDRRFATIPDRAHRGIGGDSEGGYGAVNVALHHLNVFSVVQSWSGYFTQTPTAVFAGASPATLRANSPAAYVGSLAPAIHRLGLRAWLYQGRTEPTNPALMRSFAAKLHAAGAEVRIGFFPGKHDWGLFRREIPRMLTSASRWFAQPPTHATGFSATGRSLSPAQLRRIQRHRRERCYALRPRRGLHMSRFCRRVRAARGLAGTPAV